MKKQQGINGEWIPVSPDARLSQAVIPTLVTLGTPAVIQIATSMSANTDDFSGLLTVIFWIYGVLFWVTSTGVNLFRTTRWEWSAAALAEQRRYLSDARQTSQAFWAHWWVRFPIGIVFLAAGLQALISGDSSLQLMSFVLLLSAFVTPFVFMAELALLPLCLGLVLGLLTVVTLLPVLVTVMLSMVALLATIMMVKNRRASLPGGLKQGTPTDDVNAATTDSAAPTAPETSVVPAKKAVQDGK